MKQRLSALSLRKQKKSENQAENPETQTIAVSSGVYLIEMTGLGSVTASGAGAGVATAAVPAVITTVRGGLTLTVSGLVNSLSCRRILT